MAQIRVDTLEAPLCNSRLVLESADVERWGTGEGSGVWLP